jgi:hypothetical protein
MKHANNTEVIIIIIIIISSSSSSSICSGINSLGYCFKGSGFDLSLRHQSFISVVMIIVVINLIMTSSHLKTGCRNIV